MKKTILEKENDNNAIALFKYGIIAPLVNDVHAFESKSEFFRQVANKKYILPNGKESVFAAGTIKSWYLDYCHKGFDALKHNGRRDFGLSRKIPSSCFDKICQIQEKMPHITGKAIYKKLIEDGDISAKDVSLSSIYRFLNNNQLNMPATVERKAFEMEFANDCWQRRHFTWSNYYN